jgi:quercetin dioxygenase-like cupin family protein
MPYQIQVNPFVVPTNDGKLIEEHVGLASTGDKQISIAHMIAPPGWSEPFQTPDFDEYTLVSRGKKMFEVDGQQIILEAGQSILIKSGTRVRYSNPFDEECDYWSVCLPAFSIEAVHREEQ